MSTPTTDWRVAIRRGERQPHLFFWTVEGPGGEVIYADGQHPRECINPHTRAPHLPDALEPLGPMEILDQADGLVAVIPVADPRPAIQAGVEAARVEGAAWRELREAEAARKQAALDREAERLHWRLHVGLIGVIPATEPDPPRDAYVGLLNAQAHLWGFLKREYFGVIPGSWVPARVEWHGFEGFAGGQPVQVRPV